VKYISVTKALSPYGDFSRIPKDVLAAACLRGGVIHAAAATYSKGLWVRPLPPSYQGYFDSFVNWFEQYVDQVLLVEARLSCDTYGIIGKPDLACILVDGRFVVVDLKTPVSEQPTWKAQLAAYRYLVGTTSLGTPECMSLILKGNGKAAKAYPYEYSDSDFAAFLSALNAYRYFK
jgi:hypothetical protein